MIVSVQILNTSSLSHHYLATKQGPARAGGTSHTSSFHHGTNQASTGPCPAAKLVRTLIRASTLAFGIIGGTQGSNQ